MLRCDADGQFENRQACCESSVELERGVMGSKYLVEDFHDRCSSSEVGKLEKDEGSEWIVQSHHA